MINTYEKKYMFLCFAYNYILNAPLGSLFGIAPKTDEKTLARCNTLDKYSIYGLNYASPPTLLKQGPIPDSFM
jgi:hypothetical protein